MTAAPDPRPQRTWWRRDGDGLVLAVHAQPGARRSEVVGAVEGADGAVELRVRVAARPVDGAANAALVAFVADRLDVPARRVAVVRGETSRHKMVRVTDPEHTVLPDALLPPSGDRPAVTE